MKNIIVIIEIKPPQSFINNGNASVIFGVERNPIKFQYLHNSAGETTQFYARFINKKGQLDIQNTKILDSVRKTNVTFSNSDMPYKMFGFRFDMDINEDLNNLPLVLMPGFKWFWEYKPKIDSQPFYRDNWSLNLEFYK